MKNVEMCKCGDVKINRGFRGFERISRIFKFNITVEYCFFDKKS